MNKLGLAAAVLAIFGVTAGCSGEGGESAKSRCLDVDPAVVKAISEQVESPLTEAKAVRSDDFEKVFMVAGKFESGTGVWATNADPATDEVRVIQSVDGLARQFSKWPKSEADITADGAEQAKECLG